MTEGLSPESKADFEAIVKSVMQKDDPDLPGKVAQAVVQGLTEASQKGDQEPVGFPSLAALIEHCESGVCKPHKEELDQYRTKEQARILEGLTVEEVKLLAKKHGLWPPPPIDIHIPEGTK